MSYNIDTFHVKELKDFRVSLLGLRYSESMQQRGWKTKITLDTDGDCVLVDVKIGCEDGSVSGILDMDNRIIDVTNINISGEGSGIAYEELLTSLFENSTGKMVALVVWEGGDSVVLLTVNGGKITELDMLA